MWQRNPCVYILASRRNGTLYIGVTSDIEKRLSEHRNGLLPGFTSKYGVKLLVYFEICDTMATAVAREKQLKAWRREWKIALIERENPQWLDLAADWGL